MALGGGSFITQNKVLPGAYINFISKASASASLSDRGIVTMPLELDWGVENEVFEVSVEDFKRRSVQLFGYDYTHKKLKGLRDLFQSARKLYAYRLNGGERGANIYATAKYSGVRGNDITIVIQKNLDDASAYEVRTLLDNVVVDEQIVSDASKLIPNDYVTFKMGNLEITAGAMLTGGTNGTVTGASHQGYLDKVEAYAFNNMGVVTTEEEIKSLYVQFCKRMREEVGAKFQVVLYKQAADYEGIIHVKNDTTDVDWSAASLVYYVTGLSASCPINETVLNRLYKGEFLVNVNFTQTELMQAIQAGEFVFHKVGTEIRVLEDINSLVTLSENKGEVFRENQTIRVIDQIAIDIATLFNDKYLGIVPNDESGRVSLWSDIVKHHEVLASMRAIENFSEEDVVILQGESKKSVVVSDAVTIVNAMSKLYMTVTVS